MMLSLKQNEAPYPAGIGFLRSAAVMQATHRYTDPSTSLGETRNRRRQFGFPCTNLPPLSRSAHILLDRQVWRNASIFRSLRKKRDCFVVIAVTLATFESLPSVP